VRTKDSGTYHVRVNLWLTLYKLTGWLVSLDVRRLLLRRILRHRTASPHTLYDVLVLDGGRGKTINNLERDPKLPAKLKTIPDPITVAMHCLPGLSIKTQVSQYHTPATERNRGVVLQLNMGTKKQKDRATPRQQSNTKQSKTKQGDR